jgi:hypothetical protein
LTRSFDQRSHTYLGYSLKVRGRVGSEPREFLVGVGQGAHTRHHFRTGNAVSGDALPIADPRLETVEFYKVSKLKVGLPEPEDEITPPPWRGVPPPLEVYRERGHRRLAARTFQEKCWSCFWGCQMPVCGELLILGKSVIRHTQGNATCLVLGFKSSKEALRLGPVELDFLFEHVGVAHRREGYERVTSLMTGCDALWFPAPIAARVRCLDVLEVACNPLELLNDGDLDYFHERIDLAEAALRNDLRRAAPRSTVPRGKMAQNYWDTYVKEQGQRAKQLKAVA